MNCLKCTSHSSGCDKCKDGFSPGALRCKQCKQWPICELCPEWYTMCTRCKTGFPLVGNKCQMKCNLGCLPNFCHTPNNC